MKLFKIDFGIKDRYRRGLSEGVRSNRSPQSETAATAAAAYHHDPHHHAASPTSPSALFSAIMTSSVHEPAQQWNQIEPTSFQLAAHALARTSRHTEYDDNDDQDRDASSSDGYLSSSSSSSGSSLASSSSLSPGQSDEDMESDESSEEDEDDSDNEDSQENDAPKSREHRNHHHRHHHHHSHHDYYGGGRGHGEHGGLLPIAPAPAIPPSSDRDALEQDARQRRLERDSAKRRQSLTNQAAPDASVDLTASSKDPLVMEMIRDEAEKERVDRDYDGDNSSNDIEDDEEDEDEDEDMDEDGSEEDSESDESEESESSSSGNSDEENDNEMDGSDELENMSRVSMSEYVPGCQDEGDLRLPPQGSIFGSEDMAQDHGYRINPGPLGTGGAFDLVSSTYGHDPVLHNDHVLQKMEVDYSPGYPHPPEQSNNVQLYNTPPPTTWDSPASFGQGFQFTFTPFTHTSNHQPQSNRAELHVTRLDIDAIQF
ncbi:hypothetical protein BG006_002383 [Podila minutissima]|uniref:Uncharacterized protein n=1 Tax=Podila minutissima TaxID=64525 RepID=A0A9P5SQW0_9FUNG|nr:hypothetical protein BG006_002383 [Podila minutissima]